MYNGVSMMLHNEWAEPDAHIASDSCLTGGGACTSEYYIHFRFPQWVAEFCGFINELECVVLVMAVARWAHLFTRCKLQLNCDNQVTVACINSGSSHNKVIQNCLRYLHKVTALESIDVKAVYLTSEQNRTCDLLSRMHLNKKYRDEFKVLNKRLGLKEQTVHDSEFEFLLVTRRVT